MFRSIGTFIVSLLISNWLYAELVLFVPEIHPFLKRTMQVVRIPTHIEWGEIQTSTAAGQLITDIQTLVKATPFESLLASVGVGDPNVQNRLKGMAAKAFAKSTRALPFKTGEDIFISSSSKSFSFGDYQHFVF